MVAVAGVLVGVGGVGFTSTVAVIVEPEQVPTPGIMLKLTVTGDAVVLVRLPLISPVPFEPIPVTVPVLFLVQV